MLGKGNIAGLVEKSCAQPPVTCPRHIPDTSTGLMEKMRAADVDLEKQAPGTERPSMVPCPCRRFMRPHLCPVGAGDDEAADAGQLDVARHAGAVPGGAQDGPALEHHESVPRDGRAGLPRVGSPDQEVAHHDGLDDGAPSRSARPQAHTDPGAHAPRAPASRTPSWTTQRASPSRACSASPADRGSDPPASAARRRPSS